MKKVVMTLSVLMLLFVAGCSDGNIEKVMGYWKWEKPSPLTGEYRTAMFDESKRVDAGRQADVVYKTRDGKVLVRKAGTDNIIATISILDDNRIQIEYPNPLAVGSPILSRITPEEYEQINKENDKPISEKSKSGAF